MTWTVSFLLAIWNNKFDNLEDLENILKVHFSFVDVYQEGPLAFWNAKTLKHYNLPRSHEDDLELELTPLRNWGYRPYIPTLHHHGPETKQINL
jgi:hypothetical protein